MKSLILTLILSIACQLLLSQEATDGVVAFNMPVRNSLMFNRFALNPTFSFVREQYKFASIYNKRELVQFNDAPLTYLASYSGRLGENIGGGIGLFQQNFGVLTSFGGILNFAYNARLNSDNNLTFGLNLGAYSSGINTENTVTNFADPSLQNIASNFILTINPGINYGTTFFDFGLAATNLFTYNFQSGAMLEDNPNQGLQAHIMYTGYMSSRGFFDNARFSGLLRSEFNKEETILSGNAMLYVPKGIWFQAGYNTRFGATAGAGINITKELAIEYSFEKALGEIIDFGPSHEITLAYRFKSQRYFDYNRQDEVSGLITTTKKPKRYVSKTSKPKRNVIAQVKTEKTEADTQAEIEAQRLADEQAREAQRLAQIERENQERLVKEEKERLEEQKRIAREKINAQKKAEALAKQEELERQKALEIARINKEKAALEAKELEEQERLKKEKIEAEKLAATQAQEKAKNEDELITNPKDRFGKELLKLTDEVNKYKLKQDSLLTKFDAAVEGKNTNLKNLKEENDLSDKGIIVKPKAFKSVTEENNRLKAIKAQLDDIIVKRTNRISKLKERYDDMIETDTIFNETVMLYYRKEIENLKIQQTEANAIKIELEEKLVTIQEGIEFEKRRRIKRAEYDNEEERYAQDRARLQNLLNTTQASDSNFSPEDFDFGIEQSENIKILKNVNYTESGYYMVMAVHSSKGKRDEFITKAIQSGAKNIDFFYDVNTSQYFIYQKKFESIQEANNNIKNKGNASYNTNMLIVKVEN